MFKSWTLEDGLKLVRAIQQECREYGYHVALGGGVLNVGKSGKDLDLYFLPLDNSKFGEPKPADLVGWLSKLWGRPEPIGQEYEDDPIKIKEDAPFDPAEPINAVQQVRAPWNPQPVEELIFKKAYAPGIVKVPLPRTNGAYKYKLKFIRKGGDRIDVFVV